MIETALYGGLLGIITYAATAFFADTYRANRLPGGALAAALAISPWYVAVPAALVGHFISVWVIRQFKT